MDHFSIRKWTHFHLTNTKEKEKILINKKLEDLVTDFMIQVSEKGIDEVLNKKTLYDLYKKYCTNSWQKLKKYV